MSSTPANPPDLALVALTDELRAALAPGIQLLHPLGAGGMGYVFLGRDPLLKRQVAIKVLTPDLANDDTARARFVREAESSAAVGHPNVVGIHLVGELPRSRTPYFVMQFIEGKTLGDELESGATMTESRARRIVGEVAAALGAAHARGLVHRDIKPANIMVEAESDRAVVLDFGISAILQKGPGATQGAKLTQVGTYLGTPTYMSPEQATGEEITAKSDVYSLGCVAFEMLTGKPPFQGQTLMVMAAHVKDQPTPMTKARPGIDAHLAEVVDRCLAKDAAARPTAAEVAQSLLPQAQALIEWPPPGLEPLRGAGARLAVPWAMLTAVIVLLFVVFSNQPTMASPQWADGEKSALWSNFISESNREFSLGGLATQDVSPVWVFLVGATWVGLLGLVIVVGIRTERLILRGLAAARAGYPWRVILDAAWDDTRELGGLLNASGRYAIMTANTRGALLRLLRLRALIAPGVLAGTLVTILMWTWGLLGRDPTGAFVSLGDVLLVSVPAVLGVVAAFWIGARISALGGVRRQWLRRERLTMPDGSVVGSWLATAGITHATKAGGPSVVFRWGARLTGSVALLVALFATLLLSWVATLPASMMAQAKVDARRWLEAEKSDSMRPMRWSEYDSMLARAATPQSASLDIAAGHLLLGRHFTLRPRRLGAPPSAAADTAGARQLNGPADTIDNGLVQRAVLDVVTGDSVSAERWRTVEAATASAWLPVWRRMARSAPYPVLWTIRVGQLGFEQDREAMAIIPFDAGVGLSRLNLAAAAVALRRGNAAEAELRVRENVGAARQLMRTGNLYAELTGGRLIVEATDMLRAIASRTSSASLAAQASALRAAADRRRAERPRPRTWAALFADPENPKLLEYLTSDRSPTEFALAMQAAAGGACLNARELLFGVHPARDDVLKQLAAKWDAPRAAELARVTSDDIRATFSGYAPFFTPPKLVRSILPMVFMRWGLCMAWIE